jgi:EAL domain-containing protein (putative c-di-GMP-specific phosphodiesterase class I)
VQGIEADPMRQALVAGLQHFAQRTGCRLIAEGIETAAQLETLRSLGVEYGQGWAHHSRHLANSSPSTRHGEPSSGRAAGGPGV